MSILGADRHRLLPVVFLWLLSAAGATAQVRDPEDWRAALRPAGWARGEAPRTLRGLLGSDDQRVKVSRDSERWFETRGRPDSPPPPAPEARPDPAPPAPSLPRALLGLALLALALGGGLYALFRWWSHRPRADREARQDALVLRREITRLRMLEEAGQALEEAYFLALAVLEAEGSVNRRPLPSDGGITRDLAPSRKARAFREIAELFSAVRFGRRPPRRRGATRALDLLESWERAA